MKFQNENSDLLTASNMIKFISNLKSWQLGILGGLILSLAWPYWGFPFFAFLGLVPFLIIADRTKTNASTFFNVYPGFLIWNIACTWWVWNASAGGSIMAMASNALLMSAALTTYKALKGRLNSNLHLFAFLAVWLSFEKLHLTWELTWPWLTLGNCFSNSVQTIQWYDIIGTIGGSAWILLVNFFAYRLIKEGGTKKLITSTALIILLPICFSLVRYYTYSEQGRKANVVVIQPNIDPYNEKFSTIDPAIQLARMLSLGSTVITDKTELVMLPETALPTNIWENDWTYNSLIETTRKFKEAFKGTTILGGMASAREFKEGDKLPPAARKFKNDDGYYEFYNTAFFLPDSGKDSLYHKSKLVPGVERMPYPSLFKWLDKLTIDLGGTSGSLGTQNFRVVFNTSKDLKVAPVICYESVFGDYVGDYIRKDANLIGIITNDGWWGDTPGYKQHFAYARLRAIETRRAVARSANTGISGFINQRGDILAQSEWWVDDALAQDIYLNDNLSIYSIIGPYIELLPYCLLFCLLALSFLVRKKI